MEFVLFFPMVIIYFLPFLCACGKGHSTKVAFFFANLFFGWTLIGWIVMLIMAANTKAVAQPPTVVNASTVPPPVPPVVVAPKVNGEAFNFTTHKWEATYTK